MKSSARREFGKRIYKLRDKKGWTQEDLAEKSDLSVRYIAKLESNNPGAATIDTIEKLAKAFKLKSWQLLKP